MYRRDYRLTEIRLLMLEQLAAVRDADLRDALYASISAAERPQVLWSLRHDLMQALVQVHGEMLARRRLTDISFMFAGLLLDDRMHAPPNSAPPADTHNWPPAPARGLARNSAH